MRLKSRRVGTFHLHLKEGRKGLLEDVRTRKLRNNMRYVLVDVTIAQLDALTLDTGLTWAPTEQRLKAPDGGWSH